MGPAVVSRSIVSSSVIVIGTGNKGEEAGGQICYYCLMIFDAQILAVLRNVEAFGQSNDALETDRARRMLNLERNTAELIQILVLSSRRKRVLEIGTSNGYSAIWLGATLRAVPGAQSLTTIERDPQKVEQARANIADAGLNDTITVHEGSATEIVAALPGPFDCVFFDADRVSAPEQLRLLLSKLERDVLLLADNILSHPGEVAGYLQEFEHLPEFVTTTVTVGKGLHIAYRR
jgi:predicted O-methyltransferase YrrM